MYTSLEMDHLIRERNTRLLREVRAERLRRRLQTDRVPRSAVRWMAYLSPLRWRLGKGTAAKEA